MNSAAERSFKPSSPAASVFAPPAPLPIEPLITGSQRIDPLLIEPLLNDPLLIENERIAERATFETFFRSTYPRMVRLATMMVGSPSTAEDLTQEAFTKLYARFAKVDDPHAYLRTAVVNGCRGSFRKRVILDRFLPLLVTDAATTDHDPLLSILDRLPARQKAAIILKFCDRCSEAEIAQTLGCRPGTVKSLLSRGLDTLRQEQAHDR